MVAAAIVKMNSVARTNSDIAAALIRVALAGMRTAVAPAAPAATTSPSVALGSASTTEKDSALVARLLQPVSTAIASNNAQAPAAGAAIILTELLTSTHDAAPMDLNLNQLLNSALSQELLTQQTLAQKAIAQLPPELLSKPQVIEALVLQNTLLPAASTEQPTPALPILILPTADTVPVQNANTLYQVNVEWQNRLIQLLSPQPLPTGTRVPLQIDPAQGTGARGTITLLSPEIAAKILLAQNSSSRSALAPPLAQPTWQRTTPTTVQSTLQSPLTTRMQPAPPLLSPTPAQTIQQSLREWLPKQQPLHALVPQLQKFLQPAIRERLPQPVFKALAQLLLALPKPAQVNNAENLQQTLNNSGSFFEARLARALIAEPATAEPLPKIFASDLKAQIGALLEIIRKFAPDDAAVHSTLPNTENDFIYAAKPPAPHATPHIAPSSESDHLDSLLTQLGKLLQAGFARIQLNQLDSVSARHVNHETQAPVPTWVLELPLRTPHGIDQLQLRIEQRRKQQQQRTRVQWNVEIALDLHGAGKLAVSLAIIDKSVAATLWAEREQTHRRVREEMTFLRAGLESVGVNVTEMQCRLGLPTPRSNPISQRLVDIHT